MANPKITTTTTIEYQFTLPATLLQLRQLVEEARDFSETATVNITTQKVLDYYDEPAGETIVKVSISNVGPLFHKPKYTVGMGSFEK